MAIGRVAVAFATLLCFLMVAPAAARQDGGRSGRLAERLIERDAPLVQARERITQCATDCITPSEAAALAYSAGAGSGVEGRFIFDVLGGGRSRFRADQRFYFLNSQVDYSSFGVLIIAFEADAMRALLNPPLPPRTSSEEVGNIIVERDRPREEVQLSVSAMMRRFKGKRLIVDGTVYLQWIRSGYGAAMEGRRGSERGYYQVWVRVSDPDQVISVTDPHDR